MSQNNSDDQRNQIINNNDNSNDNNNDNNDNNDNSNDKYNELSSWDDLNIKRNLLRGIYAYGFETPSSIQRKAILPIISGRDMIAQAQSGTGKTGCFAIGALEVINSELNKVQAIIIVPTHELSYQVKDVVDNIGNLIPNLKSQLFIGGISIDKCLNDLHNNTPQIIIGCPGRIYDMIRRRYLTTKDIKLLVIDEADEMLSSGFKEQIYNIFHYLPNNVQINLFSATMPPDLYKLTEKFMRNPIKILVKTEMLTLEGIRQYYINVQDDSVKYETLKDLFGTFSVSQCIIYCNSIKRVIDLYDAMIIDEFPVCQIHSNMDKDERHTSYKDFVSGKYRVLISSNITARGIDVQQVETVINFDIPTSVHIYLHRIGRSGRWGRKGIGINFITRRDCRQLKDIESYYNTEIKELPCNYKNL